MSDVEETIKRIQSQKGVVGVIVMDNAGEYELVSSVKCQPQGEQFDQHLMMSRQLSTLLFFKLSARYYIDFFLT